MFANLFGNDYQKGESGMSVRRTKVRKKGLRTLAVLLSFIMVLQAAVPAGAVTPDSSPSQTLTVSPGAYSAVIEAVYHDAGADKNWQWTLDTPGFEVTGGEARQVAFGRPVTATIQNSPSKYQGYWEQGSYASFRTLFPDSHGNLTTRLSYDSYTVEPVLEVFGNDDQLIYQGRAYFGDFNPYTHTSWRIPADLPPGEYTARVKLTEGPLGDSRQNGQVVSERITFNVQEKAENPEVPEDMIAVIVKNKSGNPMSGAVVYPLVKNNDVYTEWGYSNYVTDTSGVVEIPDDILNYGESLALCIIGTADDSSGDQLVLLKPVGSQDSTPVTVDASKYDFRQITILPKDQSGTVITTGTYSVGMFDAAGVSFNLNLGTGSEVGKRIQLPPGRYILQNNVSYQSRSPALYHLAKEINLPVDAGSDGLIEMGGNELTALKVTAPVSKGDDEWVQPAGRGCVIRAGAALFAGLFSK